MHKYSSSLSLVPHSLIHMLIQVISHTYVTLEYRRISQTVGGVDQQNETQFLYDVTVDKTLVSKVEYERYFQK